MHILHFVHKYSFGFGRTFSILFQLQQMAEKENDPLADYIKALKENNNEDLIKVNALLIIDSKLFYIFTSFRF